MKGPPSILCALVASFVFLYISTSSQAAENGNIEVAENRLSAQIFSIVDHFKQADPVGLPNAPILDPMEAPEIKKSISIYTLTMKNVKVYGLSKFRIKTVKTNLKDLEVKCGIQIDKLIMLGNYSLMSLFSSAKGPFTVKIEDVFVEGNASLAVELDGKIRTQDIHMDIKFADMAVDFQNLGFMAAVIQSLANSASNLVFDSIKPFMLKEAYQQIKTEIDTNLENAIPDKQFPNSISPLDMAIAEGRQKVRELGFDPYHIKDYNHTVGLFGVTLSNTWISGVSSFYRVGNVSISMINNTLVVGLQVGTQLINGQSNWEVSMSGMLSRAGHIKFTVQHIKVAFELSQSLDLRNRAKLQDLQLELGNIQVRCDGAGTLDYLLELGVNVIPNLLRYQIMDALENPIKTRIQSILNKIDVERTLKEKVLQYERHGVNMKLDFNLPI